MAVNHFTNRGSLRTYHCGGLLDDQAGSSPRDAKTTLQFREAEHFARMFQRMFSENPPNLPHAVVCSIFPTAVIALEALQRGKG